MTHPYPLGVVVLAAGQGKRMRSARPKVLHEILGRPMLSYVLDAARALRPAVLVVVTGHGREQVDPFVHVQFPEAIVVHQDAQGGTGHAVICALPWLGEARRVLVLYGDTPLLTVQTLERLLEAQYPRDDERHMAALLVSDVTDASGYGRVVIDRKGHIKRIVEDRDCTSKQRGITLINAGMLAADRVFLEKALRVLTPDNAQGELYLPDVLPIAEDVGDGATPVSAESREIMGVNDRADIARAAFVLRERVNLRWMRAGVSMHDPHTTWIDVATELQPDCEIGPNVELRGACRIETGAKIERGCVLADTIVRAGAHIKPYSVATEADIGADAIIGPFAHLRPGTVLAERVHVGNFTETKKTRMGRGSKANHLSYLGDAIIGEGCNIGAGTITCNYDGVQKFPTVLGDRVFIGSDTQLVAPVTLGDDVYVGAGTTVTKDAPAGALVVSRVPQVIKEGWVEDKKRRRAEAQGG